MKVNTAVRRSTIGFLALALYVSAAYAQPTISYLLPDIGTPGMNTYVEIIAPAQSNRAFGQDQLWLNNSADPVRVELTNESDSSLVRIGPIVVSQGGHMISTQIFVNRNVSTNSADWEQLTPQFRIPIRVFANGNYSNSDTFYIVKPWPAIVLSSSATLGAGGTLGKRSRRGALILAGLDLRSGFYDVSTNDCDIATAGNQGFLPCIILSTGQVFIGKDAILSVSASGIDAGPGGGGAGAKFNDDWSGALSGLPGAGFTGGQGTPFISGGAGSGKSWSGLSHGDASLNGVPGPGDVPGSDRYGAGSGEGGQGTGGGTGFCFGTSGQGNRTSNCSTTNVQGGFGGGSGASECFPVAYGGGGGGFGTSGAGVAGGGGNANDNSMLVPVAGGGGGAGGNPWDGLSGEGGGGGGFVSVQSFLTSSIASVKSDGARAGDQTLQQDGHFSGSGGGGAGGGIHIGAKLKLFVDSVSAAGGAGGNVAVQSASSGDLQFGGAGGAGRIRIDGVATSIGHLTPNATKYVGPTTDTSRYVDRSFTLTGSGNGSPIDLYVAGEHAEWQLLTSVQYSTGSWSKSVDLPGSDSIYYLVAAQHVSNPSTAEFVSEPSVVFSQSAANVLIVGGVCSYVVVMQQQSIHHSSRGGTVNYPLKVQINRPLNIDSVLRLTSSISYSLSFDSTVFDVVSVTPPFGFVVRSQQVSAGSLSVTLTKQDTSTRKLDSLGSVQFIVIDASKRHSELVLTSMEMNVSANKGCCLYQAEGASWVILIDTLKQSVAEVEATGTLIHDIYPNPSKGEFRVDVSLDHEHDFSCSVFDVRGALVMQNLNVPGKSGLNRLSLTAQLPSGKYLLRVSAGPLSESRAFDIVH